MFSLLNRGIIPRDVDLSPAFERGSAPYAFMKASIFPAFVQKPKHISALVTSPKSRKMLPPFSGEHQNQANGATFITQF
jgi:hypothetical protein